MAFWWGGFVVPQLISLVFPGLLPPDAIPRHLNPEHEGTVANAISAAGLLTLALLALVNAVHSRRRAAGWIAISGWTALGVTAAYLAWEEVSDFHITGLVVIRESVFGAEFAQAVGPNIWTAVLSPLIVAFVIAMGAFARKGLRTRATRVPFALGLVAWLLAVVHEASATFIFKGRADKLEFVLEETLEFGGTLLIVLSAVIALRIDTASRPSPDVFGGRRIRALLVGSVAVVVVLGSLVAAFVFRVPVVDTRGDIFTNTFTFEVSLSDQEAVVQEVRMPASPIGRLGLRTANRDPGGRPGTVAMRITEAGFPERVLREGRVEVPAGDIPRWRSVDFPPLAESEGQALAIWVVAEIEPAANLRLGATKTDRYDAGRLWVNGVQAWPDQDLAFVLYSAAEPTRSKLQAVWRTFTSDWRWSVLAADVAVSLTLLAFIPAFLVALALPVPPRSAKRR